MQVRHRLAGVDPEERRGFRHQLAEATRAQVHGYGYGFNAREDAGSPSFGHGGGAPGMNGDLRIYPDLGVVVVGLANVDPPAADRLVGYYLLRMPM